ncbi:DUF4192 domain-containing protein [Dactylosporangium sp. CA-233914]|uniref:DUF4192 domain-containing protein n=1 Tax=Dactylosporangium sp. CA-233914 TaxID=3239934 RepID=UPI003D8CE9B3
MASRLRLRGPAELLSAMPYLMGFHPTDSLVALGLRGSGLHLQLRGDLPDDHDAAAVLAEHYASLFGRNGIDGAILVGYGPPARAEPFLRTVGDALTARGITLLDMLRTHERRYWSLLCEVPNCCPPEGRSFEPESSVAAAEATFAGLVAYPDRDTVAEGFAGPTGPALEAMQEAANRANLRVLRLTADRDPAAVRAALLSAGRAAVDAALACYAAGDRLPDDDLAWLQVLLHVIGVRDRAWERLDRDARHPDGTVAEAHRRLWTDLVCRGEPCSVAPAATLLSYLSWRTGNGLHASIALDRALDADPGYSAAGLMAEILGRGLSPSQVPPISRSRRRRRSSGRPRRLGIRPGHVTGPDHPAGSGRGAGSETGGGPVLGARRGLRSGSGACSGPGQRSVADGGSSSAGVPDGPGDSDISGEWFSGFGRPGAAGESGDGWPGGAGRPGRGGRKRRR